MPSGQHRPGYYEDRQRRHSDFTAALKDRPCADCGRSYPPYVMDFDHGADKKYNIAKMATRNRDLVLAEIAKCDVVCSNCHRQRTHNRKNQSVGYRQSARFGSEFKSVRLTPL